VRLGRLDTVRDFVDVRDIAGALVALAREGQPGEVYNVATGIGRPLGELVRLLTELTGLRPEIETVPALVRPDDVPVSVGSAAKLRQMVRWEPQFDLRESLADMLREAEDATASEEVDPR
jgi:GDP-4-dehydro-6-deoxy-D-mannose reductase